MSDRRIEPPGASPGPDGARRRLLALGMAGTLSPFLLRPWRALAQETGPVGVLTKQVLVGPEAGGGWTGMMTNRYYVLASEGAAGQGKFFYAVPSAGRIEQAAVEVRLGEGTDDPTAGAGLIFAVGPQAKRYVALLFHPGPAVKLWQFGGGGLQLLGELALGPIDLSDRRRGPLRLGVARNEAGGALLVDGQEVGTFDDPGLLQGGAGILALSPGRFAFDSFSLS